VNLLEKVNFSSGVKSITQKPTFLDLFVNGSGAVGRTLDRWDGVVDDGRRCIEGSKGRRYRLVQ
jgi:hypothetical protein